MTTIVVAEDHNLVREALCALLKGVPDFTVIGEMDSGSGVADLVERLKPDILITDIVMKGLTGLDVTRQVKKRKLKTRVIVLSIHAEEAYVRQAFRNGAMGYVLKNSAGRNLVEAIHTVLTGRPYLCPQLADFAIELDTNKGQGEPRDPYDNLSMREREVLRLTAEGYTSKHIGEQLSISTRTVEVHRANLMRKMGFRNKSELIGFALRQGFLPTDHPQNNSGQTS
jgi:two-component system, NarL family, response regulator NreC